MNMANYESAGSVEMTAPIVGLNNSSPVAIVAREMQLELSYLPIALTINVSLLMRGCNYHNFVSKYSKFVAENPTPCLLVEGELHAEQFVERYKFEGDMASGAVIWAMSRCWRAKADAQNILRPDVADRYREAAFIRDQHTELHKAVCRLAKNKPEDSFEAGFKVKMTQVLADAGAKQLAQLTGKVEE